MVSVFLRGILLLIIFTCLSIFSGCSSQSTEKKQINVVFRFDDPSAISPTDLELKIIDAFREHNASITFGVIPFRCSGNEVDMSPQNTVPLDHEKGKLLRKLIDEGVLDIALHGYSHQTLDAKKWTEFRGLDYKSQLNKLSKGKKLLEKTIGVPVTTFVPPFNTYDQNTLKALEALGFTTLSADARQKASSDSRLNFIPFTIRLPELKEAIRRARASSDRQPLIVIMTHHYDFKEFSTKREVSSYSKKRGGVTSSSELYDLLGWLKSQGDIRILSISQAVKEIKDLGVKRYQMSYLHYILQDILPGSLKERNYIYPESPLLKTVTEIIFLYISILILGIYFSYAAGNFLFPKSATTVKFGAFASTIITILLAIYTGHDMSLHFRGLAIVTLFIGISIGLWLCFRNKRKKSG
jgi:predicted deacetylase